MDDSFYDPPVAAGSHSGEPTYSVSQLTGELSEMLEHAFPALWVAGEVQRERLSRNGHLYFELVEKGPRDSIVAKLDAVIWRTDFQRIRRQLERDGQRLAEGQQIRCFARLDFYGPGGRLQLIVRQIDPLFTLGLLERRRREVLAALAGAGLLDTNKGRELVAVPLRLGLVTSEGSAAYHDFVTGLAASGYGFSVLFVHAAMQGVEAERQVTSALTLLAEHRDQLDAVVLIRGGGARSDLAAFDSRAIAEAVARCPLPVLTGLGHEIDQAIADRVSHTALKTPTMAAEFLVDRVRRAELALETCAAALARSAQRGIDRAREAVRRNDRLVTVARLRLQSARHGVDTIALALARSVRQRLQENDRRLTEEGQRLAASAGRSIERRRGAPEAVVRRLVELTRGAVRMRSTHLEGLARLCQELSPHRLLERGFSITRDAAGRIVNRPGQVGPGDPLTTRLVGGTVTSRVETVEIVETQTAKTQTAKTQTFKNQNVETV